MPAVLYVADVVCPMTGPPLAQGGVLVEGDLVADVGSAVELRHRAARTYEVEGVLLPALVNAHTTVEHADAAELAVPGPSHVWAAAVDGLTAGWDDEAWTRSARRGVQQLLRNGVGAVGDVVVQGSGVPAACRAGLAGDSFVQVAGVDAEYADSVLGQVAHALGLPAEGRRVGIAPRAPWALGTGVLQALAALGERAGVPLQVAAAETQLEVAALRSGEGPLADQARQAGRAYEWLDGGTDLTPVRYLDACGALSPRTSIVHGVEVDVLETRLLAARGVTVVCCPGANALRGAGTLPLERYAQAGTQLALGTGSAAAAPDLDMLAEAAAWVSAAQSRDLAYWPSHLGPIPLAEQALRLATVDGARAMGWASRAGVLEPGRRADLVGVAIGTTADTVYRDLVEHGPGQQVLTVLGGVRVARRPAGEPWPEIDRHERDA